MTDHLKYICKGKGINYFDTPNQTRYRVPRYTMDNQGNIRYLESLAPEGSAQKVLYRAYLDNSKRKKLSTGKAK